jgi:hypothetical protein
LQPWLTNRALMGFSTAAEDVTVAYWPANQAEEGWQRATVLPDDRTGNLKYAVLDVMARTRYHFVMTAGEGGLLAQSPVGTFTTGHGVREFAVEVETERQPTISTEGLLEPYRAVAADALAPPPEQARSCRVAVVTYGLDGVSHTAVRVRAFPRTTATEADVDPDEVLEAAGPPERGTVTIGCLVPGAAYRVAINAVGDDRGYLIHELVSVPGS